ncbi:hypothetical protein [Promicromonospora sp. NPDC059942]|uniref:hypothetical protein n=1 Tax=Promicromonospora sp. NPDC059942 TaxID=3347009 RepID=UPI00365999C6
MGVASLAAVLMVMSGAVPASASEPSFGAEPNEPVAIFSDQVAAGISMDSELYDTIVNSPGFHYAPAPGADKQTVTGSASGADLTSPVMAPDVWAGKCEYTGRGDYPHVTNREASVHGYWVRLSGTCPSKARVTVDLQAYGCGSIGCAWITQNTAEGTFAPGSGTGRWATPHKACASTATVGWRGRVDVDLSGKVDPFGYQYSVERDLMCTPA